MNMGLMIFKRLQGGTGDVDPSRKEAINRYIPDQEDRQQRQKQLWREFDDFNREQEDKLRLRIPGMWQYMGVQEGTEEVPRYRDSLFFERGRPSPSSKEESRLYDPGVPTQEQWHDDPVANATQAMREGVYGTIGINIEGDEIEVPLWNKDMTADEAEDAARMRLEWGLSPFAPDSELEAKQNAAHMGPDDASALQNNNYVRGTSNVGLNLFRRQLKQPRKPKP